MAARTGVFILVSLLATWTAPEPARQFIVWNVGQGQWTTFFDGETCWHVDMGGEFAPWRAAIELCRRRENRISLSHWDADHISFVGAARSRLPNLCLLNRPLGKASVRKRRMVDALKTCAAPVPFAQWNDAKAATTNARSWVIAWNGVLLPGDSPRTEEKKWVPALPLTPIRILVLGHHGSRTSTSDMLLRHLPQLQMAVASSRRRRYGHPHREVVEVLRRARVPLLTTEDWGNIHIF
jgi:competence protein ComEC